MPNRVCVRLHLCVGRSLQNCVQGLLAAAKKVFICSDLLFSGWILVKSLRVSRDVGRYLLINLQYVRLARVGDDLSFFEQRRVLSTYI
jgi:hypothetical protein